MASQHSSACCSRPQASANYKADGEFVESYGIRTYEKTGGQTSAAKHGIVLVYDIFGFSPQVLQGADKLARAGKQNSRHVFVPDLLQGQFADSAWFPPDNEEKHSALQTFFSGPGSPGRGTELFAVVTQKIVAAHPEIAKWAVVGLCWGGKITTLYLQSNHDHEFSAATSAHPAMLAREDARGIDVPFLLILSEEEDQEVAKQFASDLNVPYEIEVFADQVHGFMGARADLSDGRVNSEYCRAYDLVSDFCDNQLS